MHVGTLLLSDLQSREPVEPRHRVVSQDQVKSALLKGRDVVGARLNPKHIAGDTFLLKRGLDQLAVLWAIFNVEDAQRIFHGVQMPVFCAVVGTKLFTSKFPAAAR